MRRTVDFPIGFALEVTLSALKTVSEAIRDRLPSALATDRLKVDGSGVTQPVSLTSVPLASDAATATNQATEIAGLTSIDIGIASILAKIIAAPATEAAQTTGNGFLSTLAGIVSAGRAAVTEASAAAILAKLSSDPSTATLQTAGNASLASILAKLIAAPSTEAKQDAGNASLVSILAKIIAAPATEAKQDTGNTSAATTATQTTTTATNTGTIAGAVGAHDTTLPAGVVEIAGIGQTSAPTAVTSGRTVRAWFSLVGAQMVGLLGANGSAIASVTNAVPVGGKDGSGNAQPFLVNASGVAQTSAAKGTSVSSTAAEASHVISASACLVARASMLNGSAATRYLQLHNATSLPSNGAVPVAVIIIGTTQTQVMTFNIPTDKFGTGCVAATSTTGSTLTIGSADALFTVDLFPTNV